MAIMDVTHSVLPHDLTSLSRRFVKLQVRLSSLSGQAQELRRQQAALVKSIALTKARVQMAPEVTEVFEYMQEKAHARAVGEFEDLLSAFVQDVVPHAGEVRLELGTDRGAPALEIYLDNGGDKESILEGNGGGLTNVVVTGLAFSALSRTQNRQLMVLDEPDCWLKATYIPAFTRVLAQVANPQEDEARGKSPGVQTLMISHNDVAYMDEGAHIKELRLEKDLEAYAMRCGLSVSYEGDPTDCAYVFWDEAKKGEGGAGPNGVLRVVYRSDLAADDDNNALTKGFPVVESLAGARPFEPEHPGIRWIEVKNLRSHPFTRLELSAGLNVLAGDINSGKSTLYLTALRALAYGETDDTMIRHGAAFASVRVGLEDGIELEVVRQRKGSPRVLFRRYEHGKLVNEGRPESRNAVPEFITSALRISKVDDLDIQLRSQKQPVFLLNEPPARRAKLLSVGKESGLLQELLERHRLALRRDREQLKREEAELAQINRTLRATAALADLEGLVPLMNGMLEEAQATESKIRELAQFIADTTPIARRSRLFSVLTGSSGLAQPLPLVPELQETKELADTIDRLSTEGPRARVPIPNFQVTAPSVDCIQDAVRLGEMLRSMTRLSIRSKLQRVMDAKAIPTVPELHQTDLIAQTGVALKRAQEAQTAAKLEQTSLRQQMEAAVTAFDAFKQELGVCPACDTPFGSKKEHSHD